jgi:AraC-like DNA-binding protein
VLISPFVNLRDAKRRPPCEIAVMISSAEMARVELQGGGFDALRASHFVQRFPPHFHETFAIGVVETGETRLRTHRGVWIGGPGTILAFAPGEIHGADPLTADGYTYRMLYPSESFMREAGMTGAMFTRPVIEDAVIARALLEAHEPLMNGSDSVRAESRMRIALEALVRGYDARGTPDQSASAAVVTRAQAYLRNRFAERVRLASLAEECGVSRFQIIRRFRRVTGVTPFTYLAQIRVNRAQAMLSNGCSLSDVAYSCGFSDQSHMTRAFKQAVGMPPGQYVRSVRPEGRSGGTTDRSSCSISTTGEGNGVTR